MVERVNSCMIYSINCKNLCKCYSVPPPNTIKKKRTLDKALNMLSKMVVGSAETSPLVMSAGLHI
jgi:hypothetical protein